MGSTILKYQEQFNIPNIVNLVYGDNKLLLNLSLANHRYLLMKEYKKHKRVRLVESFLPQSKNDHVYEIVTPIYKNHLIEDPKSKFQNIKIQILNMTKTGLHYIFISISHRKIHLSSTICIHL